MVVLKKNDTIKRTFYGRMFSGDSQADWNTETAKKEIPQTVLSIKTRAGQISYYQKKQWPNPTLHMGRKFICQKLDLTANGLKAD